ncbi:DUF5681 domain-containing protein [Aurantiacibacter hainanensis]|uniref:DUF5681 domain-containing protein n=1 Tax=Aurantiacibacter hainanensis TaxID=3076114 RepID=UPI0030C6676E
MSNDTRFQPGQSGNPKGRPKKRRPHNSAFDIIFDKTLTVTQSGKTQQLTIDEALELQTYHDAIKGSRMAIRKILKMIEKRERALRARDKAPSHPVKVEHHHDADNANEAMRILGIAEPDPGFEGKRWKVRAWAAQAALSRPGRRKFSKKEVDEIKFFTFDGDTLRWPRGRTA